MLPLLSGSGKFATPCERMQALNRAGLADLARVVALAAVVVGSLATDGVDEPPQPAAASVARTTAAAEADELGMELHNAHIVVVRSMDSCECDAKNEKNRTVELVAGAPDSGDVAGDRPGHPGSCRPARGQTRSWWMPAAAPCGYVGWLGASECEAGAAYGGVGGADGPALALEEAGGDREAEAGPVAVEVAGFAATDERLEDVGQEFGFDP
jgi:hypothetical protein